VTCIIHHCLWLYELEMFSFYAIGGLETHSRHTSVERNILCSLPVIYTQYKMVILANNQLDALFQCIYLFTSLHVPSGTSKTMNHNQLMHYTSSTADTSMASSTIPWHYLNTSIILLSYSLMNKFTYNNFTTTVNSFQNNTQTSRIQCFSSSLMNIIRHTTLET
jgi:hypothetical protein